MAVQAASARSINDLHTKLGVLSTQNLSIFEILKEIKADVAALEASTARIAVHETIIHHNTADVARVVTKLEVLEQEHQRREGRAAFATGVGAFITGVSATISGFLLYFKR